MYLSSEEYSQGFSTLEGFVGIGVGMQETVGGVQISEVMRFSAAEEAGLQIGDIIIAVDGNDTTEMTSAEVAELLRGEEGTAVSVTVRRQGRDLTVTCTRRQVNQVYVSNSTMADGRRVHQGQRHGFGKRLDSLLRDLGGAGMKRIRARLSLTCAATAAA